MGDCQVSLSIAWLGLLVIGKQAVLYPSVQLLLKNAVFRTRTRPYPHVDDLFVISSICSTQPEGIGFNKCVHHIKTEFIGESNLEPAGDHANLTSPMSGRASWRSLLAKVRLDGPVSRHFAHGFGLGILLGNS